MRSLLAALGSPHAAFPAVVVAGSVGKGTTCLQIAARLDQPDQDFTPGLFTGPHLHSIRERFVIGRERISQAEFIEGVQVVTRAAERVAHPFSTFERTTALAFWWFSLRRVRLAILEIGMGGRFDAVNTVPNILGVLTPIEMEHIQMLGGSLQSIAWHKAGIIQPDGGVISTEQSPLVSDVIAQEAAISNATLEIVPAYRLSQAACANLVERGLAPTPLDDNAPSVRLPGRLEWVQAGGHELLLDGGHTPGSAQRLRRTLTADGGAVCLVVGMLRDKQARDYLAHFDDPACRIILTRAPGHRGLEADALAAAAQLRRARVQLQPDPSAALDELLAAPENQRIVAGSLRLVALAREHFGLLSTEEQAEAVLNRMIFEGEDYLRQLPD
jgi:dihydrofolate synthase/folylpolyglutamate synthase